jgi:hypothetical protein
MCFSAPVSFVAAAVLLSAGAMAVRRTRRVAEWAYALIPAWFGVQQLLEGGLWLTLDQPPLACLNTVLTQGFSVFSQVVWPLYIPLAVWLLEPVGWRRRAIGLMALAGAVVSLYLLWYLLRVPAVAQVQGRHIAYIFPHFHQPLATALYLLGACVSPLLSGFKAVRLFGLLATLSLLATAMFYSQWFISVWCFFAALLSSVILLHFRAQAPVNLVRWRTDCGHPDA